MLRVFIAGALVGVIGATVAAGQPRSSRPGHGHQAFPVPITKGFILGAHTVMATGTNLTGPEIDGPFKFGMGGGAGVYLGYGFTPQVMAFASIDLAKQGSQIDWVPGSMGLRHIEVGGRMSFAKRATRMVPYLIASIGRRALSANAVEEGGDRYSIHMSGIDFSAGGGILYGLGPQLSLDAGLVASYGKYSRGTFRGDFNDDFDLHLAYNTNFRLKVGFQWTPR